MQTILRIGTAPNFIYQDANGKKITDQTILEYIKSLRIPPAYTQVNIHIALKNGKCCAPPKLTYTGIDSKNRTQYGYSQKFRECSTKTKFGDLITFGQALPKIRARITELLKNPNASRQADTDITIALLLKIVLCCHFRLGTLKYKELYKSYGVTTLEVRHLKFINPTATSRIKVPLVQFDFIGKKAVRNQCSITDPSIITHLANITAGKAPKDPIFTTFEGVIIRAADVNTWMRQFGVDLSSKMFRTFSASVLLIHMLNSHARRNKKIELPESLSATHRKRALNMALDAVSGEIHNTRAICKKSYVYSDLIDMYLTHPRKYATLFMKDGIDAEKAFLDFLISSSQKKPESAQGGEDAIDSSDFWFN